MKNLLLGTDICQISRIEAAVEKYGARFLNKVYTKKEIEYAQGSKAGVYERLAVRFAAKEAVSKAFGVGINKLGWSKGINWKDVEVKRDAMGVLSVGLSGRAKELAAKQNITGWKVSVSHNGDYATATVIGIVE